MPRAEHGRRPVPLPLLRVTLIILLTLQVPGVLAVEGSTEAPVEAEPNAAQEESWRPFQRIGKALGNVTDKVTGKGSGRESVPADPAPAAGERLFSNAPLPMAWFEQIVSHPGLSLDLSMEEVGWEGLDARHLESGLRVDNGRVIIDLRRLELGLGGISGQLVVEPDASPPRITLSLLATDIDIDDLRLDNVEGLMTDGRLDIKLELRGQGRTLAELMASADGQLELLVEAGHVRAGSVEEVRGPLWMFDVLGVLVPGSLGNIAIRCGVARLNLEGGVLTEEVLAVVTEHTLVTGRGRVDFADETVDLLMVPRRSKRFTGALSPPVRVAGTITQPRVSVAPLGALGDPGSLLERLSASVVTPILALGGGAVHDCATTLDEARKD